MIYSAESSLGGKPLQQDMFLCEEISLDGKTPIACFAVFDGHGSIGN
jgi:serine/threonine protein phosphatase PrpC